MPFGPGATRTLGAGLLFVWQAGLLLAGTRQHALGADEFEHLHFAWLVGQGQVPYRDFFEHHHPLLWAALAPLAHWGPQSLDVALIARLLFVAVALLTAIGVGSIAARLHASSTDGEGSARAIGPWAAAAWLSLGPVQASIAQVRPDPWMVCALVWSLRLALGRGARSAFSAGVLFSIAFLLLQKAVLFLPVLCLAAWLWPRPERVRRALHFFAGGAVPIALAALALAATGAFGAWWDWAVVFNRTAPPLDGTWYLRGLWSWRKAASHANALALAIAAGAALWLGFRAQGPRRWFLSVGALTLLALQVLPRRPYFVYALPASLFLAGLIGFGVAALLQRLPQRATWAASLFAAAALAGQALPASLRALSDRGGLERQLERSRHALARVGPKDTCFQGYPPFAIQVRDAGFMGWMPLEMALRAREVALDAGPAAEQVLRDARPAFVSLGTAVLPMTERRDALARLLRDEMGYRFDARFDWFVRPDLATEVAR